MDIHDQKKEGLPKKHAIENHHFRKGSSRRLTTFGRQSFFGRFCGVTSCGKKPPWHTTPQNHFFHAGSRKRLIVFGWPQFFESCGAIFVLLPFRKLSRVWVWEWLPSY
jgi:hypothetical protein